MVNDQAFPSIQSERETFGTVKAIWSSGGLSKRELYSAIALQALLSNEGRLKDYDKRNDSIPGATLQQAVAAQACSYADALIAELAKGAK